jgi:hypothetical protein
VDLLGLEAPVLGSGHDVSFEMSDTEPRRRGEGRSLDRVGITALHREYEPADPVNKTGEM